MEHINFWSTLVMVNFWTETIAIKGNTEVPLVASKDVVLEVNAEKIQCTLYVPLLSRECRTKSR